MHKTPVLRPDASGCGLRRLSEGYFTLLLLCQLCSYHRLTRRQESRAKISLNWLTMDIQNLIDHAMAEKNTIPPDERIDRISRKIDALQMQTDEAGLITLLIWIIHLLTELGNQGEIRQKAIAKIDRLSAPVFDLLEHRAEDDIANRLRTNYQIALSKIRQKQGDHFAAAWELEVGFSSTPDNPLGGFGNRFLGEGVRLLRLGLGGAALSRLNKGYRHLSGDDRLRAHLSIAKTFRLVGELDNARKEIEKADELILSAPDRFRLEAAWELGCIEMMEAGRCGPILNSVLMDGSHHLDAGYVAEAIAWGMAFDDEVWLKKLPSVKYALSKKDLKFRTAGFLVDCLEILENCRSAKTSVARRVRKIGQATLSTNMINGIDREQLFLVAAARVLAKLEQFRLAALVLSQYWSTSLKLTHWKNGDHLGIAQDLVKKSWFKHYL
jgi:hypothetical protein